LAAISRPCPAITVTVLARQHRDRPAEPSQRTPQLPDLLRRVLPGIAIERLQFADRPLLDFISRPRLIGL